uniref:Uncharacterized protein n=1 Tax=Schistosoma mansoni TaxID=6183 RepID=A0A5K4F4A2_SCHMA
MPRDIAPHNQDYSKETMVRNQHNGINYISASLVGSSNVYFSDLFLENYRCSFHNSHLDCVYQGFKFYTE